MNAAAEKDIRRALRQLQGCIRRLNMARASCVRTPGAALDSLLVMGVLARAGEVELDLRALLGAERPVPRRKVRLKYPKGDAKGVF